MNNFEKFEKRLKEVKLAALPAGISVGTLQEFFLAVSEGYTDVAKHLLTSREDLIAQVDSQRNYAIRIAARRGHLELVRYLLTFDKVEPSACNNYALRHSAKNKHAAIVNCLVQIPSVTSHPSFAQLYQNDSIIHEERDKFILQFKGAHEFLKIWRKEIGVYSELPTEIMEHVLLQLPLSRNNINDLLEGPKFSPQTETKRGKSHGM